MRMFVREIIVGKISTSFLAVPLLCRHTRGFKVTTFLFLVIYTIKAECTSLSGFYYTIWWYLHVLDTAN